MTDNNQITQSRPRRWLQRAFPRRRRGESRQSSDLGSLGCVEDGQSSPYQGLADKTEDTRVSVQVSHDPDTVSGTSIVPGLSFPAGLTISSHPPSPNPYDPQPGTPSSISSPLPYGFYHHPHSEVSQLDHPRPVLIAKNSSAYFQPCDIYGADPDIHPNGVYSNGSAASSSSSLASSTHSGLRPLRAASTSTRKRSCIINPWTLLKTGWQKFTRVFDPQCFWKMIDMREIFFPFTWKRYITLTAIALMIGAIVVTELFFHWIGAAMAITRQNMLPVLILVLGLEPIMIVIILMCAKIPDLDTSDSAPTTTEKEKSPDLEAQRDMLSDGVSSIDDHRTALVIPCHNSDHEAMLRVLASAYPHFRPCDIFIIDNARSMHPSSNTFREFIHSQHAEINYIWSPVGSKNYAQLVGAVAAEHHEFIMTVDDDVCIPASFRPPVHKINDVMKGVGFPLKATNADGKVSFGMVAWQDCEYRMAGLTKLAEEQICGGALFPHGAGWFCERETMIDLISNYHSLDFIAEDVNTGLSMMRMEKSIGFDATCVLETEVPTTVFGKGLNWYHQRVRSWEMGRHGRLLAFLDRFFFSLNGLSLKNPIAILAQKFILFYSIACIIVDWVRVPVIVTMGLNGAYWRQALLLSLVSMFPILWFKYISCRRRPDLQPSFWGAVTIPVYKQLYYFVSVIGGIRALIFYVGGHKRPLTVKQMIKVGDERVLWLDARWAANKGFLADEGVALRLAKEGVVDCAGVKGEPGLVAVAVDEEKMLPETIAALPQMYLSRSKRESQTSLEILPASPRA